MPVARLQECPEVIPLTLGLLGLGRLPSSCPGGWGGRAGAGLRPRVPVTAGLAATRLQMALPPAWRPAQMLYSCTSIGLPREPRDRGRELGGTELPWVGDRLRWQPSKPRLLRQRGQGNLRIQKKLPEQGPRGGSWVLPPGRSRDQGPCLPSGSWSLSRARSFQVEAAGRGAQARPHPGEIGPDCSGNKFNFPASWKVSQTIEGFFFPPENIQKKTS